MNWLLGGNEDADVSKKTINPVIFNLVLPIVLAVLCFYYGTVSQAQNTPENPENSKINTMLYSYGGIYSLIIVLYGINSLGESYSFIPKYYTVLVQKLVILSLVVVSGYSIYIFDKTNQNVGISRKLLLGISIISLLSTLPLLKAVPSCVLDNINTDLYN